MAIGDTVNAGLMRVDFSPIQRAGEAQAKANQAFGDAVGGVIDKFYQKKKEKQEKEQLKQAYLKLGMPEEVADAAKNDKDLANQFINKINSDRNYNLEMDKFNQAGELRNLQMDEIKQNMENEKADRLSTDEAQISENQFLQTLPSLITDPELQRRADIAQPGLPALGNADARNRFMQAQLDDPKNQVPVMNLNDRDFLNQFKDDPQQIKRALAFIENRRASQPKPRTPEEEAKYQKMLLENQKLALELDQKINPKPTDNLAYTESTLNAISDAENILEQSGLPSTGFWGDKLQNIGGTNAADLKASIENIVSAIGFDKLQDIRDRAETGGALGQVSDRELAQLNASLGSLKQSQSKEQFKKNLMRVKDYYQKYYKATMAEVKAYEQGLKFDTEEEAISWMNKNFPTADQPASNNQTYITTPGNFRLLDKN